MEAIAAERAKSQYILEVGEKVKDMVLTYVHSCDFEVPSFNGFGMTVMYIHMFKDENGNKLVWKTSSSLGHWENGEWNPLEDGITVKVSGTVKDHSEYNGEKQTVLQRVKVIAA